MTKRVEKELSIPMYIRDLFRAAAVADNMAREYAGVSADKLAQAWNLVEEMYPQIEGYYYSYNGGEKVTRHKRPDPKLTQK